MNKNIACLGTRIMSRSYLGLGLGDINILLIFELRFYFTKHYVIDKPHSFAAQLLKQTNL